jgi:hypothetical protein
VEVKRQNHAMPPDSMHLKLLLCIFSGWVHRQQGEVIDYLVEENRVLKEQLKGKRLRLSDTQRRRLAAKAKILGRPGVLKEIRKHIFRMAKGNPSWGS